MSNQRIKGKKKYIENKIKGFLEYRAVWFENMELNDIDYFAQADPVHGHIFYNLKETDQILDIIAKAIDNYLLTEISDDIRKMLNQTWNYTKSKLNK